MPPFLAHWIRHLGRFEAADGTVFVPTVPTFQEVEEGVVEPIFTTSFPSFRILARFISNQVEGKPWDFPGDPPMYDPSQFNFRLLPGLNYEPLTAPLAAIEGVIGFRPDFLPPHTTHDTVEAHLNYLPKSRADDYLQILFAKLYREGVPMTPLQNDVHLGADGTNVLRYAVKVDVGVPLAWKRFTVVTTDGRPDVVLARCASVLKCVLVKDETHTLPAHEDGHDSQHARWDASMYRGTAALGTGSFNDSEVLLSLVTSMLQDKGW